MPRSSAAARIDPRWTIVRTASNSTSPDPCIVPISATSHPLLSRLSLGLSIHRLRVEAE
jgi:hypothetical protein